MWVLSIATSTLTPGQRARNGGISPGRTKRAVGTGTLSRSVPTGRCVLSSRSLKADAISASAGRSRSSSRAPASVGVTLRVLRWSRRSPRSCSSLRMRSLSDEADSPRRSAAARKPPASTTAANGATSLRSGWRTQGSPDCTGCRTRHSLLPGLSRGIKRPAWSPRGVARSGQTALPPGGSTMHQTRHPLPSPGGRIGRRGLFALGLGLGGLLHAASAVAHSGPEPDWGVADIPAQDGRIFLVTGGTSGMGYEDAKALAGAGAQVVIAARNAVRGEESVARIRQAHPGAQVRFETLDLADLASVRALGDRL